MCSVLKPKTKHEWTHLLWEKCSTLIPILMICRREKHPVCVLQRLALALNQFSIWAICLFDSFSLSVGVKPIMMLVTCFTFALSSIALAVKALHSNFVGVVWVIVIVSDLLSSCFLVSHSFSGPQAYSNFLTLSGVSWRWWCDGSRINRAVIAVQYGAVYETPWPIHCLLHAVLSSVFWNVPRPYTNTSLLQGPCRRRHTSCSLLLLLLLPGLVLFSI